MKITLITVGKIKEKYLKDAIAEYSKRLSKYCKLDIIEVSDEKTPAYIEQVLEILNHTSHEGYYVKMAVAWAVSVCYVKFPIQTKRLLLANEMDDFTHNKAIQKIRESYRVSREEKVELNRLKR